MKINSFLSDVSRNSTSLGIKTRSLFFITQNPLNPHQKVKKSIKSPYAKYGSAKYGMNGPSMVEYYAVRYPGQSNF